VISAIRDAVRSRIRRLIARAARGYVAGPRLLDARRTADELISRGYGITLAYWDGVGEDAAAVVCQHEWAIDDIVVSGGDYVSLKAPSFGYDHDAATALVTRARSRGVGVHFDSLDHDSVEPTLELIRSLPGGPGGVGITAPGRWRRSPEDAAELAAKGAIVRIVPDSLFTLEELAGDEQNPLTRLKLAVGKVFVILFQNNGQGGFEIETPSGVAAAIRSGRAPGACPAGCGLPCPSLGRRRCASPIRRTTLLRAAAGSSPDCRQSAGESARCAPAPAADPAPREPRSWRALWPNSKPESSEKCTLLRCGTSAVAACPRCRAAAVAALRRAGSNLPLRRPASRNCLPQDVSRIPIGRSRPNTGP